ncbi:anti-sigma factor [Neorhizobium lilium]|uniref:Anti-sigma factor n=1 Tax=Neorhizobium lilium TaxID=2503024 RepID=A0A3S3SFX2_9HYPH|nr:anti-sigma factor [Neorhizobium lilium]RWX79355.1 anti-sigma factor [Neorhizobium lilium]
MSSDIRMPSDEDLTAFLDGEMSPQEMDRITGLANSNEEVAARIEFLAAGGSSFREAFAPLLEQAPKERLEAMLAGIPTQERKHGASFASRRGFFGALAASLVIGVIADRTYLRLGRSIGKDEGSEWRLAVAQYIALYTADTLAGPVPPADVQAAQLARIDSKLDLALSPETVALPGPDFKRAQLLQYEDRPLAQIVYLDPESGPMALCIIHSDDGAKAPDVEGCKGMNVVYWSTATHAFMLIGHAPVSRLREIANTIRPKFTA